MVLRPAIDPLLLALANKGYERCGDLSYSIDCSHRRSKPSFVTVRHGTKLREQCERAEVKLNLQAINPEERASCCLPVMKNNLGVY